MPSSKISPGYGKGRLLCFYYTIHISVINKLLFQGNIFSQIALDTMTYHFIINNIFLTYN